MKRLVSAFMAAVLLTLSFAVPVFAQESSDNSARIDSLFDERAELICLEKWDEVDSIDRQLESLGVEKLTAAEEDERFGSYVSAPTSTDTTWFSSRVNYTYNGVTYEIQTLTAQPNRNDSCLKQSGSRSLSSTDKRKAGGMNALSIAAFIGSSMALTVYDSARGFVNGVSKTAEISSAEIVYSYAHTTTASFKYVKVSGQSDDYQVLSYASTKGTTAVGYQYPTFIYSGGSVKPNIIQGSRTINSTPEGYNSNLNAIKAFTDPYAPRMAYVKKVQITGLEWEAVSSIYPPCPQFPTQIF